VPKYKTSEVLLLAGHKGIDLTPGLAALGCPLSMHGRGRRGALAPSGGEVNQGAALLRPT